MIAPPLIAVVPPALVVRVVRALVAPTAPPNVVVPVELAARLNKPLTVLTKLMSPAPAFRVVFAPRVTASL